VSLRQQPATPFCRRPAPHQHAAADASGHEFDQNYRSHNGILRCANVLVSLLVELFPSSVNHMRLDEYKTAGDAPILLPDVTPLELCFQMIKEKQSFHPGSMQ